MRLQHCEINAQQKWRNGYTITYKPKRGVKMNATHRSVTRRRGPGRPQAGKTGGETPQRRFGPLIGHYDHKLIALVAGVHPWTLPTEPAGSGRLYRWQPEEDAILLEWPLSVCRHLLPWRTDVAIRSRRRDIGPKTERPYVTKFVTLAKKVVGK